ncbi:hypothetical protein V4836_08085 [Kluyvera ascorbata]|uniref:Uncharacterized protein n=1 Tax=Kluyvera ascorbata TaxID=51288 RepID=A0AB35X5R0_9ENTR
MITFNPEKGIKNYIKNELAKFGHRYNENLRWEENLLVTYSLNRKIPSAIPRAVIELPDIIVPPHLIDGYNSLKRRIIKGSSIRGHLSTTSAKFKFHDLLLNYWNIHHLHLSDVKYNNGFYERTGYVVFCVIYDNAVIIIDIMPHPTAQNDGWFNIELIEKIHLLIPEVIDEFKTSHLTGHILTATERKALHTKHMNYAMRLKDGTVYTLNGVMSNGESFKDTLRLMHLKSNIAYLDSVVRDNISEFEKTLNTTDCELTMTVEDAGRTHECLVFERYG